MTLRLKLLAITIIALLALGDLAAHAKAGKDKGGRGQRPTASTGQPVPESLPRIMVGDPETAKVLIGLIYDKSCYAACQKVQPLIKEIVDQYPGRVAYVEMDLSDQKDAERRARQCRIYSFLSDSTDTVPLVAFFNAKRKNEDEVAGAMSKDDYLKRVQKLLAKKD